MVHISILQTKGWKFSDLLIQAFQREKICRQSKCTPESFQKRASLFLKKFFRFQKCTTNLFKTPWLQLAQNVLFLDFLHQFMSFWTQIEEALLYPFLLLTFKNIYTLPKEILSLLHYISRKCMFNVYFIEIYLFYYCTKLLRLPQIDIDFMLTFYWL